MDDKEQTAIAEDSTGIQRDQHFSIKTERYSGQQKKNWYKDWDKANAPHDKINSNPHHLQNGGNVGMEKHQIKY